MQYLPFLHDKKFHEILVKIDESLAENVLEDGCQVCGGKLHCGDYPRKPHGLPLKFWDIYSERISFCCSRCNKRHTPPSVRFFGRYWYVAPVLILMSALVQKITDKRINQLYKYFGIHVFKSTLKRWQEWWRSTFYSTSFWTQTRGILPANIMDSYLPIAKILMKSYRVSTEESLIKLLHFITPLSYGFHRVI